jgi:hypothetical protein
LKVKDEHGKVTVPHEQIRRFHRLCGIPTQDPEHTPKLRIWPILRVKGTRAIDESHMEAFLDGLLQDRREQHLCARRASSDFRHCTSQQAASLAVNWRATAVPSPTRSRYPAGIFLGNQPPQGIEARTGIVSNGVHRRAVLMTARNTP